MNERQKGIVYTVSSYAVWGILPIYWSWLKEIPSGEILAHRIIWSFLFVLCLWIVSKRMGQVKTVFSSPKQLLTVFLSGLLISANWFIYIWAVNHGHVIESSLGYYINPLLSISLGMMVLREKLTIWQMVSVMVAAMGVLVITVEFGKIPWIAFSLALTFALYGLVKKMVKLDSMVALGMETLMVTPIALIYLMFLQTAGQSSLRQISLATLVLLLCAGIITALPLYWFAQGAKRIPLSMMGFIQYLSPSITLLLGVFLFKEPFTRTHILSFGLIWAALILYTVSSMPWATQFQQRWRKEQKPRVP